MGHGYAMALGDLLLLFLGYQNLRYIYYICSLRDASTFELCSRIEINYLFIYNSLMPIPFKFDFKSPDYRSVIEYRTNNIIKLRQHPEKLPSIKKYYRENIAQFIIDWGVTYDPRNIAKSLPSSIPFLLFEKQEEWVNWLIDLWKAGKPGLTDKSRDMGVSWLSVAVAVSLCTFYDGMTIGFGSRKEIYVDNGGDPASIFFKVREFIKGLPIEFRSGWNVKNNSNSKYMQIHFPNTRSNITGETGPQMGRGGRSSIFFKDESAFIPHSQLVDAALSENTNCCIDISTPFGQNNSFARKRFSGSISVKTMHWRDHPAKDEAWYKKKCEQIIDPLIIAMEIDLDYQGSVENTVLNSAWVQSSIDAHIKLGINNKGMKIGSLDIADQGSDMNAFCGRYGILISHLEQWSGKDSDIFKTMEYVFGLCDEYGYEDLIYDADGLGASAKGDSRVINERREGHKIILKKFQGSGEVVDPEKNAFENNLGPRDQEGRTNADFFHNRKAQAWWSLRRRFLITHKAVTQNCAYDPDDIISISSQLMDRKGNNLLQKLTYELTQPRYKPGNSGKMLIDKMPVGECSPNLADAVMMAFAPQKRPRGYI